MTPIRAPPHLPLAPGPGIIGLTQQDYAELNSTKTAKLLALATWDWDSNRPVSSDPDAFPLPAGYEDSKRWDTEWWRKSLCTDYRQGKPVFMPGRVYDLGSISGSWQGRLYVRPRCFFVFRILMGIGAKRYTVCYASRQPRLSFRSRP